MLEGGTGPVHHRGPWLPTAVAIRTYCQLFEFKQYGVVFVVVFVWSNITWSLSPPWSRCRTICIIINQSISCLSWSRRRTIRINWYQSINQSIDQSVNQSMNQSVNEWMNHSLYCHGPSKNVQHMEWGMMLRAFIIIHTFTITLTGYHCTYYNNDDDDDDDNNNDNNNNKLEKTQNTY